MKLAYIILFNQISLKLFLFSFDINFSNTFFFFGLFFKALHVFTEMKNTNVIKVKKIKIIYIIDIILRFPYS